MNRVRPLFNFTNLITRLKLQQANFAREPYINNKQSLLIISCHSNVRIETSQLILLSGLKVGFIPINMSSFRLVGMLVPMILNTPSTQVARQIPRLSISRLHLDSDLWSTVFFDLAALHLHHVTSESIDLCYPSSVSRLETRRLSQKTKCISRKPYGCGITMRRKLSSGCGITASIRKVALLY
jgi:hypothetical protein